MKHASDIIETILLTEKASILSEKENKYVFRVSPKANKLQIRQAVQELLNVKVTGVNTMNCLGKRKRQRTQKYGRTSHWKKAIVQLAEGEKIDLT